MVVSRKRYINLQQLYSQVYCWAADPLEPELKEQNAAEIPTLCIYSLKGIHPKLNILDFYTKYWNILNITKTLIVCL